MSDWRRFGDFILRLLLAITVLACASTVSGQTWGRLKVQGKQIVDQNGHNVILRGLDPGEWYNIEAYMIKWPDNDNGPVFYGASLIRSTLIDLMGKSATDEFYRRWEANIVTESDVQKWASLGVNSARLSINYHWLTTSDGVYLDSGWQRIDRFVEWCKKAHIWVILCLHAAPGAQSGLLMADGAGTAKLWTESSVYRPWTIHLWQAIAKRYAQEPTVLGYDLLDEPILPADQKDQLRAFYIDVTKAIRSVDSDHILFVEGHDFAMTARGMASLEPAWDDNMVFDFHKYWDKKSDSTIRGFLEIRDRTNRPLWNGETGENSNEWARYVVALCERNNIGWNWWTYKKVDGKSQLYTIHSPPGYDKILKYVRSKGPKPSPEEAAAIMLALADNAATDKCAFNAANASAIFGHGESTGNGSR
ncbi:MAG: cellulase family glycosylhydrolase [Candidatus Sulfotelmatobacter sp.]